MQYQRKDKATYHLPEFLGENRKNIIHKCSNLLNIIDSSSEDLPHKIYSSKQILHNYQLCKDNFI